MRELVGERAGEALDRLLAGGVGGGQRHRRQGDAGGHVDDDAGPALAHLRDDRLGHGHHAEGVGVEDLADMRHRRRLEGADDADAGIVDEHVDRAGGTDGRRDAVFVGDVERQDAQGVGCGQDIVARRAHGGDDVPALPEEVAGGFPP
jgi:hypothetical protein